MFVSNKIGNPSRRVDSVVLLEDLPCLRRAAPIRVELQGVSPGPFWTDLMIDPSQRVRDSRKRIFFPERHRRKGKEADRRGSRLSPIESRLDHWSSSVMGRDG